MLLRHLLLAPLRSQNHLRRLQLRGQVHLHRKRNGQGQADHFRRSLARFRVELYYSTHPLQLYQAIPHRGSLEKRRRLRGCRHLLLPALLCDWRAGPACEPSHLPSVLRPLQRLRQHRSHRSPLLGLYHARHPSFQQAGRLQVLQGRVRRVQLQVADGDARHRPGRHHLRGGCVGRRWQPGSLDRVLCARPRSRQHGLHAVQDFP
mmetsp:Transcript_6417/g.8584  ORF Transcript_6417/g.8584 Transcript_6417/m.8584 type:complete len:205 (+) Transcript_6417:205-819(+)